jgi:cell division protein FtsB
MPAIFCRKILILAVLSFASIFFVVVPSRPAFAANYFEAVDARFYKNEADIAALAQRNTALEALVLQLSSDRDQLRGNIKSQADKIDSLTARIQELEDKGNK